MTKITFEDWNDLDNILIYILDNSVNNPEIKEMLRDNNIEDCELETLVDKVKANLEKAAQDA